MQQLIKSIGDIMKPIYDEKTNAMLRNLDILTDNRVDAIKAQLKDKQVGYGDIVAIAHDPVIIQLDRARQEVMEHATVVSYEVEVDCKDFDDAIDKLADSARKARGAFGNFTNAAAQLKHALKPIRMAFPKSEQDFDEQISRVMISATDDPEFVKKTIIMSTPSAKERPFEVNHQLEHYANQDFNKEYPFEVKREMLLEDHVDLRGLFDEQ